MSTATALENVLDLYGAMRRVADFPADAGIADADATLAAAAIVAMEARLLDARRYDRWLALWADEAHLWVPLAPGDDPASDQALFFDDRRRLEERVWRMGDPNAWALVPPPHTTRTVGPVEAWPHDDGFIATSTIEITAVRRGLVTLSGRQTFRITHEKIAAKILVLPTVTEAMPHLGWLM